MGRLFEGQQLGQVLRSRTATFSAITSVPTEMMQSGVEPPLAAEAQAGLLTIAHNALTNAFLHAQAGRVEVKLDFGSDAVRLSVSDDGVGPAQRLRRAGPRFWRHGERRPAAGRQTHRGDRRAGCRDHRHLRGSLRDSLNRRL